MLLLLLGCRDPGVTLPDKPIPPDDTLPEILSSTPCDACGGDCLLEELVYGPSIHTTAPIDYQSRPPAGGPHNPCWSDWGIQTEPVPDDNFVHNLEHGGVVYLYACEGCAEVATLDALALDKELFVLVTSYPDMEAPFAALAWGWRLTTGCVDSALFSSFYDDHVDQAPESIPSGPGDSCM